jgi:hypothetical protein
MMLLGTLIDTLRTGSPVLVLLALFGLWMLVDAVRRGEWLWAVFIFIFPWLNALLYYFLVYRRASPVSQQGWELPGAADRRRIKELQDQIHHLDKAHHHLELGDIYFHQGKLAQAEASYRASVERDPEDPDAWAHLGQCLLRQNRPQEALPALERVVARDPQHDFGHTLMALAETLTALGRAEEALTTWRRVLEQHTYARARVQMAELLATLGQTEAARKEAREVLADEAHTPEFQRRRDRVWIRRARALLRKLGASAQE